MLALALDLGLGPPGDVALEHAPQHVRRNARPIVLDHQERPAPVALDRDPDLAVDRREAHRVLDQVLDHGLEQFDAAAHAHRIGRDRGQPHLGLGRGRALLVEHGARERGEIYGLAPGVEQRRGDLVEAACWAHARRKLFELAELRRSPIALEAVRRIDALFALERTINGAAIEARIGRRQAEARPLIAELHAYLSQQRARLSATNELAKAIDYGLERWSALTRYLDDGRLCLSNNAAERALRGVAIGRRNWSFAGSDAGGERAAALYTLIETAKLNEVDPRAWLADVLTRLQDHPARRIAELLPWNWQARTGAATLAA
jgi:hypothetical protein